LAIAADAVTSAKILDGTITYADIADQTIQATKLNSITVNGTSGQMLTSNGSGGFNWVAAPAALPTGTSNYTMYYNGSNWVASSALQNSGANITMSGDLALNGGDLTTNQTTATLFNTTATTVNIAGAGTNINIGATTGTTNVNNDLAVKGGDLTTNQTTATLFNTTATTLNIGGAATTTNIGSGTGTSVVKVNNNLQIGAPSVGHIAVNGSDLTMAGDAEIDGNLWVDGNFYNPSDERLKSHIETLTGVLARIDQLRGVSYEFKDQQKYASGPQVGVIAQELQKVFPELVTKGADGYLAVNYSQLTAVLIQAVKEQQQQINDLKQQMAHQQQQINEIMTRLDHK
ncbi:tail fiber domain-containing protein, partial [Labilibaculum sp. K2S]|uniref:tail fiber domain-containing protein n=1 Tax=Labilibaculum sp. K2S TaxID=3056386 RepID=UPI0025A4BBFD